MMKDIMRTNDIVAMSFALSVLQDAGLEASVADTYMSVLEGSIGAFPRRLQVRSSDAETACSLLREAGLGEFVVAG